MRRAMSKKKAAVRQQERQNFVYGNEAEGVPGCISRGIPENVANKIYDDTVSYTHLFLVIRSMSDLEREKFKYLQP